MKLNVIATSLVLSSVLFSGATLAADGTVHFRGEVIDSTCTVTTDTSNQTVNIGRVSVKPSRVLIPPRLLRFPHPSGRLPGNLYSGGGTLTGRKIKIPSVKVIFQSVRR